LKWIDEPMGADEGERPRPFEPHDRQRPLVSASNRTRNTLNPQSRAEAQVMAQHDPSNIITQATQHFQATLVPPSRDHDTYITYQAVHGHFVTLRQHNTSLLGRLNRLIFQTRAISLALYVDRLSVP
jgi:hypothetical protein